MCRKDVSFITESAKNPRFNRVDQKTTQSETAEDKGFRVRSGRSTRGAES
jgi:hypothetical protein